MKTETNTNNFITKIQLAASCNDTAIAIRGRGRSLSGGGGANIHIFMLCIINFFWNQLFLRFVNTNI